MELQKLLNWEVIEEPVMYTNGEIIKERKALVRSDNHNLLEIVGDRYVPFPNKDFIDIIHIISEKEKINESDITLYETNGGRKLSAIIDLDYNMSVRDDVISNQLLVQNSHDGKTSLKFGFGNLVYSCSNGLFTFKSNSEFRFRHDRYMMDKLQEIIINIETVKNDIKQFNEFSNLIVNKRVLDRSQLITEAIKYVTRVDLSISKDAYLNDFKDNLKLYQFKYNTARKIKNAIHLEMDNKGDNFWGLLNGFTYFTNHVAHTRDRNAFLINGYGKVVNEKAVVFIKQKLGIYENYFSGYKF